MNLAHYYRILRAVTAILFMALTLNQCSDYGSHTLPGYIEGEYRYLAAPYSGTLKKLAIKRGDHIEKDQLLYILDPQPQAADLDYATQQLAVQTALLRDMQKGDRDSKLAIIEAQVQQAEAELELAQSRLKRIEKLYNKGMEDKDSLQEAQSHYKETAELLKQQQATLAEAKLGRRSDRILAQHATIQANRALQKKANWSLEQKQQVSPIKGRVHDTYYQVGEWVSSGQSILSLLAPEDVHVVFFLPEKFLHHIQLEQKINVTCKHCEKHYIATVTYISTQAEFTPPVVYSAENTAKRTYRIEASLEMKEALHPGQPVTISFNEG